MNKDISIFEKFEEYFFKGMRKVINFLIICYFKIRRYFYIGNFIKKHITVGFIDGKIQITSTNHADFIVFTQKKINKLANKNDRKEFIKLSLKEALGGCNFIIFSIVEESNKYVQFWTGEHQLKYNFYANEVNKLKNNFLSIVGLLSEMEFVNSKVIGYRGQMTFKIDKGKDYISVDANFEKDIDSATEFIDIIFKQIYKTKGSKLVAKVE